MVKLKWEKTGTIWLARHWVSLQLEGVQGFCGCATRWLGVSSEALYAPQAQLEPLASSHIHTKARAKSPHRIFHNRLKVKSTHVLFFSLSLHWWTELSPYQSLIGPLPQWNVWRDLVEREQELMRNTCWDSERTQLKSLKSLVTWQQKLSKPKNQCQGLRVSVVGQSLSACTFVWLEGSCSFSTM